MATHSKAQTVPVITYGNIIHDTIVGVCVVYAWYNYGRTSATLITAGLVAYFLYTVLKHFRGKSQERAAVEQRRVRDAEEFERLGEFARATRLVRAPEAAEQLIRETGSAEELVKLLDEGIHRVPASSPGDPGYGRDTSAVARCATTFNRELVRRLVPAAVNELAENPALPAELVDDLLWHYGAQYPSTGFGYNLNMGRQIHIRPRLKKLIERHGITARHTVAQKLFCHAVGYSGVPGELPPQKWCGPHERHAGVAVRDFVDEVVGVVTWPFRERS